LKKSEIFELISNLFTGARGNVSNQQPHMMNLSAPVTPLLHPHMSNRSAPVTPLNRSSANIHADANAEKDWDPWRVL
jgi:hypothetical protein